MGILAVVNATLYIIERTIPTQNTIKNESFFNFSGKNNAVKPYPVKKSVSDIFRTNTRLSIIYLSVKNVFVNLAEISLVSKSLAKNFDGDNDLSKIK